MKPNILFIMTDQQSAEMMSCTGNRHLNTPAMDSIAEHGVRFERAYCTDPVCVPSRFSLFTGKMPSYINLKSNDTREVDHDRIDNLKKQGIGFVMKKAGYEAVYGGKQHLPGFGAEDLGFDILTLNERDTLAADCAGFIKENREKPFFLVASFINPHDICYMAIRDFAETDQAKKLIESGKTEVGNIDTFLDIARGGGSEFIEKHCPPLPKNHLPQAGEPEAVNHLLEQRPFRKNAREKYSDDEWRMHRYVYHRLTEMVDEKIGIVLDALKESGQEENTVVIFTSDHGDMDGSHKLEHKTVFYNEASRVPLLMSQKGVIPEGVVNTTHLISNGLDLIPTLCDYAETEVPEGLEGRSLRAAAEGKTVPEWRDAVKLESEIGRMIITKDYKYARFYPGSNDEQLYDLANDPYETRNSAYIPENRKVLEYHRQLFSET